MSVELITRKIENNDGNYCRNGDDIYISYENMNLFLKIIEDQEELLNILITPYLICENSNTIYELHYYEFELEVTDIKKSYFIEYSERNTLPEEIVKNIKPKGIVAEYDKIFYIKALKEYLTEMVKMEFKNNKEQDERLKKSSLYFQIF